MNETENKTIRASRLPEVWPGWETVDKLGSGSYGAVYQICRQTGSFTEYAAVKHISIPKEPSEIEALRRDGFDDESITENFREQSERVLQEYRLMSALKGNTNIVDCDDVRAIPHSDGFGTDLYIKMELLTPLDKREASPFQEEEIARLGCDLCTALELCEKNNIIHRDIKPANIFVSKNGNYKLGDFGVSRIMESSSTNGGITGTPRYMAPEVYTNRKYGHTADICSLGLVLYWLLNEQRTPFQPLPPAKLSYSGNEEALNRRMRGEPIPAPKNGSEGLKRIVLKAVSYDPKERYQTASEMKKALEKLNEPTPVPPPPKPAPKPAPKPEPKPTPPPKKPLWLLAAIPILVVVLLFASGRDNEPTPTRELPAPPVTYSPTPAPESTPTPHVHSWSAANCTRPATCTICGEEQGSALGHSWVAATYEQPRHCSVCGEKDGEPLAPTPSPTSPPSSGSGVELFTENSAYSKRNSVAVAHSQKLDYCESSVKRLRDNGYNAFLYEETDKSGYTILIGVFGTAQEAKDFAEYLHTQPEVKGVKLGSAYAVSKVRLSDSVASRYGSPWY